MQKLHELALEQVGRHFGDEARSSVAQDPNPTYQLMQIVTQKRGELEKDYEPEEVDEIVGFLYSALATYKPSR